MKRFPVNRQAKNQAAWERVVIWILVDDFPGSYCLKYIILSYAALHEAFEEILPEVGALMLTSANPRGGTPRTLTGHRPSTIVDFTGEKPKILRQGELKIKL